jgi:hypothetical protein
MSPTLARTILIHGSDVSVLTRMKVDMKQEKLNFQYWWPKHLHGIKTSGDRGHIQEGKAET